jgi:hypothetical protein
MEFDPSRLRRGEWIAGAGAVLLLVIMFVLPWYGLSGSAETTSGSMSLNAWHSLSTLRWLMLVTIVAALSLCCLQATRSAPALPVSASVITTPLAGLTALALLYRVLINTPGDNGLWDPRFGAFLGVIAAWAIAFGAYRSLREEGLSPRDAPQSIATVRLEGED